MEEGGLLRFSAFLHIKEQVDSISIQSIKLTPISFVSHTLIQLHLFFSYIQYNFTLPFPWKWQLHIF